MTPFNNFLINSTCETFFDMVQDLQKCLLQHRWKSSKDLPSKEPPIFIGKTDTRRETLDIHGYRRESFASTVNQTCRKWDEITFRCQSCKSRKFLRAFNMRKFVSEMHKHCCFNLRKFENLKLQNLVFPLRTSDALGNLMNSFCSFTFGCCLLSIHTLIKNSILTKNCFALLLVIEKEIL